jgi:serine/threonine protein kinase
VFTGINPRSATPLYLQIAESVRRSVATGELKPGEVLPSVRAVAAKLRVNPATVSQAYRELERDGLADSEGDGSQAVVRISRTPPPVPITARGAGLASGTVGAARTAALDALARLEPGLRIEDRFEVRRLLGAGAMGAVYLAHDLELDEDVAIKVLPPLHTADETAVKRFINEIRLARRISHRNVVRTHDVGRWTGGLFLTMEYVAGRTVREVLDAEGRLSAARAVALTAQLVDALVVAHAAGVIHRDLKPQNLLIDPAGDLKVLDFGIAVVQGTNGQLTEAGLVVGTPAYMAPEQLMGETLTPASDLYAVGVLLYELLAGRLPYSATSPMSLVAQIVSTGPTPIQSVAADVEPSLGDLVMRLLAHEPAKRPASAATLLSDLRALA